MTGIFLKWGFKMGVAQKRGVTLSGRKGWYEELQETKTDMGVGAGLLDTLSGRIEDARKARIKTVLKQWVARKSSPMEEEAAGMPITYDELLRETGS